MATEIKIPRNNTHTINVVVEGLDCTGYTPYLTVKINKGDLEVILSKTGVVTYPALLQFFLTSLDSSLAPRNYVHDITIEADASIYTPVFGQFIIEAGVRY